jgi:hypothetical protein
MYHLLLEAFACLKVWPLGHDGSVLLSVVAQALLYNFVCRFLLFSLFRLSHWRLSVGSPGFLVLHSVLEPVVGIELPKEVFTSRARWMSLIVEWNASANMFYLLKNLLLLIIVIFKLKCNNLMFNEIMVLNASYVCLHAFSLRRESPDLDPGRWTPHFWGGSVTTAIRRSLRSTAAVRFHLEGEAIAVSPNHRFPKSVDYLGEFVMVPSPFCPCSHRFLCTIDP